MAPKRSAGRGKAGEAAGDDAEVHGWMSSKCADSHLLDIVGKHLLQPRNVIHWRRSDGESFPHEGKDELLFFFLTFFGASVFPFLISSAASFTIGGLLTLTNDHFQAST